jgi:hypothetical protein
MKWFFLASFVAALIRSVLWTGIIIFEIATSQLWGMGIRAVAGVAPLFFFIWGARETFRFFKNARS